jgi:hypothetical protein
MKRHVSEADRQKLIAEIGVPTKNSIGLVNLSSCEDCYRIDALR